MRTIVVNEDHIKQDRSKRRFTIELKKIENEQPIENNEIKQLNDNNEYKDQF